MILIQQDQTHQRIFDCKVHVVDAFCGYGKTTTAINHMLAASDDEKFLFITPYKEEIKRIKKQCSSKHFKDPQYVNNRKLNGLKQLINKGENIASTHSLFHRFDQELIDMCRVQNYTLIMDEVTDVVDKYPLSDQDFQLLITEFVTVDKNTGLLRWRPDKDDYNGKFSNEKRLCELNSLALYGNTIMMWLFPIEVFNAFKEIYILTYMFEAQIQRYYYDFYKVPYDYIYISGELPNTKFSDVPCETHKIKHNYKELIHIVPNKDPINEVGSPQYALSKTWYERNKDNIALQKLKKNLTNFFINRCGTKSDLNLWTTFRDYKHILSNKGYTKAFVSMNMRATNDYRDRISVAYAVNRYLDPNIKQFFSQHDIIVNEDDYALSEMLQFIWRSAIRENNPIQLYIPSSRMRKLLTDWINKECENITNNTIVKEHESHVGLFYFGQASIPFHAKDDIYQIKCLWRLSEYSKEFKTRYLQFKLNDKINLSTLNSLQSQYIQMAECIFNYTADSDIFIVDEILAIRPIDKQNYKNNIFDKVYNRLAKMAIQKKSK